jgi:hypothetical protein
LRPIVLITGGVGEELAEGDFVGAGEMGKEFGDFVVEGELVLLLKKEDGGCGELLTDGANAVAHGGSSGCARIEAGVAVGVEVEDLAVFDYGEGGTGDAGLGEGVGGEVVDFLLEVGGEGGLGAGGGETEEEKC